MLPKLELPGLSPCPIHPGGPPNNKSQDCKFCWERFWFKFDKEKHIIRINNEVAAYEAMVERYKETHNGKELSEPTIE